MKNYRGKKLADVKNKIYHFRDAQEEAMKTGENVYVVLSKNGHVTTNKTREFDWYNGPKVLRYVEKDGTVKVNVNIPWKYVSFVIVK